MSKLRCRCDHVIADQTDNLPYKAFYLLDEGYEAVIGRFTDFCQQLFKEYMQGSAKAFIKNEFEDDYPVENEDIGDSILEAFNRFVFGFQHVMYECEVCGRLWLQFDRMKNRYVSYQPESDMRHILHFQEDKKA